jgi:hypothetical protein
VYISESMTAIEAAESFAGETATQAASESTPEAA